MELPPDVVALLGAWAERARREGLRLVAAENLHVTLAFLGSQADPDPIAAALDAVPLERVRLGLSEPAWLPPRRPGVLALDFDDVDGACSRLQSGVVAALGSFYAPESRPFRPHVTVARVRKGARVDTSVPEMPDRRTFAAPTMTLYRSRPGPQGARYDALTRRDLP